MVTRPIFPFNAKALSNLVVRAPLPQNLSKLPKARPIIPSLSSSATMGLQLEISNRSKRSVQKFEQTSPERFRFVQKSFNPKECNQAIKASLGSNLSDVIKNITTSVAGLIETTLQNNLQQIQQNPEVNLALNSNLVSQSYNLKYLEHFIDSTPLAELEQKPQKKKKGFLSKIGSHLKNCAKKGLRLLGGRMKDFISKRFGFSL